jgi:hypothetical protein
MMQSEADYASVLRDEFGLALSDEELRSILAVMQQRGSHGAPHPFFA